MAEPVKIERVRGEVCCSASLRHHFSGCMEGSKRIAMSGRTSVHVRRAKPSPRLEFYPILGGALVRVRHWYISCKEGQQC